MKVPAKFANNIELLYKAYLFERKCRRENEAAYKQRIAELTAPKEKVRKTKKATRAWFDGRGYEYIPWEH